MAKSVAKYKGFYISRYEAGWQIMDDLTEEMAFDILMETYRNIMPEITEADLIAELENMGMSALEFVTTMGLTRAMECSSKKGQEVMENTRWNFYTIYEIIRKNGSSTSARIIWGSQYDQVIRFLEENELNDPSVVHTDRGILNAIDVNASTGDYTAISGSNNDIMSNIYDLEGNCSDVTLEASEVDWRMQRGDNYWNSTHDRSAAYRSTTKWNTFNGDAARVALMIDL